MESDEKKSMDGQKRVNEQRKESDESDLRRSAG